MGLPIEGKEVVGTPNDIHKEVEGTADCLQERELSRNIRSESTSAGLQAASLKPATMKIAQVE
jgi:hypothetical protein